MAWSISMTREGWDNVRRNLHGWDKKRLVDALCDDRFEAVESKGGTFHATAAADKNTGRDAGAGQCGSKNQCRPAGGKQQQP